MILLFHWCDSFKDLNVGGAATVGGALTVTGAKFADSKFEKALEIVDINGDLTYLMKGAKFAST